MALSRTRLKKVERAAGCDQLDSEFEKLVRFHYNLRRVSDAALIAGFRATIGEIELPGWAADELQRPIPKDAERNDLQEARHRARKDYDEILNGDAAVCPEDIQSIISSVREVYVRRGFRSLAVAQEALQSH